MDDYYTKYARPLGKLQIIEVNQNLSTWRENLREELESLIYMRNGLSKDNDKIEIKVKNKLLDIVTKLENISIKEIECISEFLFELDKNQVEDVDDKIYTKLEYIRDNYNKILLNVQKMASSSPILLDLREKYEKNKTSLINIFKDREKNGNDDQDKKNVPGSNNATIKIKESTSISPKTGKDWKNKLNNDVDLLNKEKSLFTNKIEKKEAYNKNLNSKTINNLKDNSLDKDIDSIIKGFQNNNKNNKSTDRKASSIKQKVNISLRSNSKTRNYSPLEKSNTANGNAMNLKNQTANNKVSFESINSVKEELEHIKQFCKELKKHQDEVCIIGNEKKIFDKIKNENIKLHADLSIIKEDIKEILSNYQHLVKRINFLEEENGNLRTHNKNIVKYIQQSSNQSNNINFQYYTPNRMNHIKFYGEENMNYNDQNNNINVEHSLPLSELSAFNTVHNQSSVEMINNINNNLERTRKRRFLIPKAEGGQFP